MATIHQTYLMYCAGCRGYLDRRELNVTSSLLTPAGVEPWRKRVLIVEDWAEIRRLRRSDGVSISHCAGSGLFEADQAVSVLNQASSTSDKEGLSGPENASS
jgi:hypothetical protein